MKLQYNLLVFIASLYQFRVIHLPLVRIDYPKLHNMTHRLSFEYFHMLSKEKSLYSYLNMTQS